MTVRDTVLNRTTGTCLAAVLKLMASSFFNRRPEFRRELYRRRRGGQQLGLRSGSGGLGEDFEIGRFGAPKGCYFEIAP